MKSEGNEISDCFYLPLYPISLVLNFLLNLCLIIRDAGQIIFTSSNMGLPGNADIQSPAYRMTKAAINMYCIRLIICVYDFEQCRLSTFQIHFSSFF